MPAADIASAFGRREEIAEKRAKREPHEAALKVVTGRRQTKWTGATKTPKDRDD
jgi:hypothetical protein